MHLRENVEAAVYIYSFNVAIIAVRWVTLEPSYPEMDWAIMGSTHNFGDLTQFLLFLTL